MTPPLPEGDTRRPAEFLLTNGIIERWHAVFKSAAG
jgi:hypothetical protein